MFLSIAVAVVVREVERKALEVSEISVPASLAETGLTPSVAAHRLVDAMQATARAVRAETSHRPTAELEGSTPDLHLPASGLSVRGIAALISNLMGWPQHRLSGEIIISGEQMRLRLRLGQHGVIADIKAPASEGADALLLRAAPEIFRIYAPRLYAWHIAQSEAEEEDIRNRLIVLRRRTNDDDAVSTIDYLIARSLIRSGLVEDALELLRPIVAEQPQRAAGHFGQAMALLAHGDLEGAVAAQRRGIALDPMAAWAHISIAVMLRELGRFDEAMAAAREAQRLDEDDRDGLTEESHVLRRMGRLHEAATMARRALAIDPEFAPAHAALGHTRLDQNDARAALAAFETALRLSPRLADGHAGQGITLAAMGRHADALEALSRAAVLDGMDYRALHAKAGLLALNDQWAEALDVYDAAIRRAPRVARLHEGRGVTLAQLGRRMEAVQALQTAVALGLEDPAAHQLLREMETTPG